VSGPYQDALTERMRARFEQYHPAVNVYEIMAALADEVRRYDRGLPSADDDRCEMSRNGTSICVRQSSGHRLRKHSRLPLDTGHANSDDRSTQSQNLPATANANRT
jgi:hypothetical protein